jgi:hypothetical protein
MSSKNNNLNNHIDIKDFYDHNTRLCLLEKTVHDINNTMKDIKLDINNLRLEIKSEIKEIKSDMKEMRTEIKDIKNESKSQFHWIMGFIMTGFISLLIKSLF